MERSPKVLALRDLPGSGLPRQPRVHLQHEGQLLALRDIRQAQLIRDCTRLVRRLDIHPLDMWRIREALLQCGQEGVR